MSEESPKKVKKEEIVEEGMPQIQSKKQTIAKQKGRQLVDVATILVIKVATCNCNHKDTCGVYQYAKKIAEIIDELQSLKPSG